MKVHMFCGLILEKVAGVDPTSATRSSFWRTPHAGVEQGRVIAERERCRFLLRLWRTQNALALIYSTREKKSETFFALANWNKRRLIFRQRVCNLSPLFGSAAVRAPRAAASGFVLSLCANLQREKRSRRDGLDAEILNKEGGRLIQGFKKVHHLESM